MSTLDPITADRDLDWLLENLRDRTPGVRHVLVLSQDGLKLCFTPGLDDERGDQLAAIASAVQSLSAGVSHEFGEGAGGTETTVRFRGGLLMIVPAGDGAHLAVVADDGADVAVVEHNMRGLVEQLGVYLGAALRLPEHGASPVA